MSSIQTILVGVAAGYAATVWAILGLTALRLHRWWSAAAYAVLGNSNLVIAYVLTAGILGREIVLPPWLGVIVLAVLFDVPALRELRAWRSSQAIIRDTVDE